MRIIGIFEDIEGEGMNRGLATVFLRLAQCNLRCAYCDTKYAYKKGREITVKKAAEIINKSGKKYVNITGGEPLLQKKSVVELVKRIKGKFTAIETNGTVSLAGVRPDMISMDLKLPSSGEAGKTLISNLKLLRKKDQLKLVIGSKKDMDYAARELGKNKTPAAVVAQPVYGKFPLKKIRNYIMKNNLEWRVGIQLHKLICNN